MFPADYEWRNFSQMNQYIRTETVKLPKKNSAEVFNI